MLSFTTDPYPPAHHETTRQALEIIQRHGLGICTLTKGGKRALRDIDLFRPDRDAFASTLTSLDAAFSRKWERAAADPARPDCDPSRLPRSRDLHLGVARADDRRRGIARHRRRHA